MSNYDAWLEKPYQDRYAREDAYVNWCEDNDLDPSDDLWDEFEQEMLDRAEDAAIEAAEAAREWERERDYDDYY